MTQLSSDPLTIATRQDLRQHERPQIYRAGAFRASTAFRLTIDCDI